MKTLVIGFGSIGQRHARILGELGCDVAVMSRRTVDFPRTYTQVETALIDWKPDYVVIADRTSEHLGTFQSLARHGFRGRVLVEKPLFDRSHAPPNHAFAQGAVGYNLRFHPLVTRLREFLAGQAFIVAAHVYVGQYLPQWRPAGDYRQSYSSRRQEGGGVLRDLSHELDYVLWMFGPWVRLAALGGHFSSLEIDSDDVFSLLLATKLCPVISVQMNYLDRGQRREILVHTGDHSVRVDLNRGIYEFDGRNDTVTLERDATYRGEHRAMLDGDSSTLCSFEEGMEVMSTIEAAERAAARREWIMR
jgi:predicted dehydrogenase